MFLPCQWLFPLNLTSGGWLVFHHEMSQCSYTQALSTLRKCTACTRMYTIFASLTLSGHGRKRPEDRGLAAAGPHPTWILSQRRLGSPNGTNPTVTHSTSGLTTSYLCAIAMNKALTELCLSLFLYSYVFVMQLLYIYSLFCILLCFACSLSSGENVQSLWVSWIILQKHVLPHSLKPLSKESWKIVSQNDDQGSQTVVPNFRGRRNHLMPLPKSGLTSLRNEWSSRNTWANHTHSSNFRSGPHPPTGKWPQEKGHSKLCSHLRFPWELIKETEMQTKVV